MEMDKLIEPKRANVVWSLLTPQILLVLLVVVYFPTFVELSGEWSQWDESLAHSYPLLIAFVVLLFRASPLEINKQSFIWNSLLVVMLIVLSLTWFLFHYIQIKILEQLILLPILYCMIAFIYGIKTLWKLRFLLIMPIFVFPFWDYLNDYLVQLSSLVVGDLVRLVRIPALIDGNSIFIPSGHIMIADGCSGLRYLIISLSLGYAISYLNGYKEVGLFASLLLAAVLGLIANWLRIFILILVGYFSEMQSSLMQDHETFGWVLFGVICFPAIYFAPVIKHSKKSHSSNINHVRPTKFILLLIFILPGYFVGSLFEFEKSNSQLTYQVNSTIWHKDFVGPPLQLILPASQKQQRFISSSNVYLQIDQYWPQAEQERLVPYIPRQYNVELWVLESSRLVSHKEKKLRIDVLRKKSGLQKIVQGQWFDIGGHYAATVPQAKLLQIPAVLSGHAYFSIFTLQLPCLDEECLDALKNILAASEKIN
jgi:exosortase